jgi:hypothetical protein
MQHAAVTGARALILDKANEAVNLGNAPFVARMSDKSRFRHEFSTRSIRPINED